MDTREAFERGYRHQNLPFWLGLLRAPGLQIQADTRVLDIGCGTGLFLQLLYEYAPFQRGLGIDTHEDSIQAAARSLQQRELPLPIEYECNDVIDRSNAAESFDVAFCQEVFWMVEDLSGFASAVHAQLSAGGVCYATVGVHKDNPLWSFEQTNGQSVDEVVHVRTIGGIASVFSAAGFAVGVRPLPVEGYVMYDPDETQKQAKKLHTLAKSTFQEKMLFAFYKGHKVHSSRTLRG